MIGSAQSYAYAEPLPVLGCGWHGAAAARGGEIKKGAAQTVQDKE